MKLERDGESFLDNFCREMYRVEQGVPRDCWKELATWIKMPELIVDMSLEVEIDDILSKPMNALFYEKQEGRPCGFVINKLPMLVHDTWRPLIERLEADPLSICTVTAAAISQLQDPRLRELKTKQVQEAFVAAKKEFEKLYQCVYEGHMLFLWLWHPKYSRSAARALCSVLDIPDSADLDPHDIKDQFMCKQFEDSADVIRKLWLQYRMQDDEVADVVKMTRTDSSDKRQKDLATAFPHYDYFLFIKYAALCTANHYVEGTFSNQVSLTPSTSTCTHPHSFHVHMHLIREHSSESTCRMSASTEMCVTNRTSNTESIGRSLKKLNHAGPARDARLKSGACVTH